MIARGNSRPKTGGRKKGTPNKVTAERSRRIAEAAATIEGSLPNAFKGDAHAYLMTVYKNEELPIDVRLDAAKAAISYEKPKLAAIQHKGDVENPVMPREIRWIVVEPDGRERTL